LKGRAVTGWTFADIWETNAEAVPERDAVVHGDTRVSWADMNLRANGVANALLEAGVSKQDKVAQYLYNCAEFMESQFAILKAGLVPVNTNYRYAADELTYLWNNADAVAVVFHGTFSNTIEHIRTSVPAVKLWLWVDDGSGVCPAWATPYEQAATGDQSRAVGPWGRDGSDLYMLYTGGTTGMPKGVMWPQQELIKLYRNTDKAFPTDPDFGYVRAAAASKHTVTVPCAPLMHGTGAFSAHSTLHGGGTVVTLTSRSFDAYELLDVIEREGVHRLAIVGDAFAKPWLRALDARPGERDISSLFAVLSSGVMWSEETKQGLLAHHDKMLLVDAFSSSEALGMGTSTSTGKGAVKTAKFDLGERAIVIDDDGNRVVPGSGVMGRVAVKGILPVGYYKDPEKTARTFVEIEGERYSTPGDYALVEADGSLTLLGRGSACINTGGEKVFPEEVEETLKRHHDVVDAVVVGLPDEKFGEAITGVVELADDATFEEDSLIAHVKEHLASYKAPKRMFRITSIGRAANGKIDYKAIQEFAAGRASQTQDS
jgi:acyl-CoA synthetase (AMP-forming)/AMP-acid ligase II